jgi:hypothetical protein
MKIVLSGALLWDAGKCRNVGFTKRFVQVSSHHVNAGLYAPSNNNVFFYGELSVCRYSVGRLGSNNSDKRQNSARHSLVIVSR